MLAFCKLAKVIGIALETLTSSKESAVPRESRHTDGDTV